MKRKTSIRIVLFFFVILILTCKTHAEVPYRSPLNTQSKQTGVTPISPVQKASDLSIEKVYLKDCRIYVVLKNIGSGGVTDEDYQSGELMVLVKKGERDFEKNPFKLKDVDPKFILKTPAQQIEFDTKIKCSEQMQVKVLLSGLKADSKKGKKEYAATLVPLKFCLEEGIRKIVPATGPGSSPKVLKSEQQDKREFMMKPPESTVPKIAPSTEIIKSKRAKSEELKRPEMKKAETIFHKLERMRGCPQHGKVYYYTLSPPKRGLLDWLYIWEQGQSKESGEFLNVGCYGWPTHYDKDYEDYEFNYKIINIDDRAVECVLSSWACLPPENYCNILYSNCYRNYIEEFKYGYDYFNSTDPSGKRFYIELRVKRPREKGGEETIFRTGTFTLINYDIEAKKYEFGQAESPVPSNPFKMELTYKDINLMTPQVIYLKDEGEEGYHYITLRDVTLKLKTKDGSDIRNNECVKYWINGDEGELTLVVEFIQVDKKGNLSIKYGATLFSPRELRYTIEKDTLTIPSLKVPITLPSNYYQIELRPKIKVCESRQYELQPLAKIIVYESSKDKAKPFDINIKGFKPPIYASDEEHSPFVKYLTPDVYYLIFNLSPPLFEHNLNQNLILYYQDPQSGQWVKLKEYKEIGRDKFGDFNIRFSLEDLKKIYFGNKVNLKLEWLTPYNERICVKEFSFPFKNIVIFRPKIGDKLYLNHPFLIEWASTDKSGDVVILCYPGSKFIARVQNNGKYWWTPTSEFKGCWQIEIVKIGVGAEPSIRGLSNFDGVYQIGVKIINPIPYNTIPPGPIQIMWELYAPENERNGKIKLYYRINKRIENRTVYGDWQLIADNISVNEKTWMWEVPNITETNKWCEIKIVWEKYIGDQRVSYEDISSFSIKPL